MKWTNEQQKVIDARNRNILVSAAAGSGKTAVLVERIIQMITDDEHPIDIDRLLVVTFTKAAASQMKERIGKAIEKRLVLEPENENLRKQSTLLQSANIMTIHSFCLNVIRNYFHMIDLDPAFKLAEETDVTLLQTDLIDELLEEEYETEDAAFYDFIESYASSKTDAPVADLILKLYRFSMSYPWPKEWLEEKVKAFELSSLEEMENSDWMQRLLDMLHDTVSDLQQRAEEMLALCNAEDGPQPYLSAVLSDLDKLDGLMLCKSYNEYHNILADIKFDRLSTKKQEGVDEAKKEAVKSIRDTIKKGLKDMSEQFFFAEPEEMLSDIQKTSKVMRILFDLTSKFIDKYARKKEEKNILDFNDLEHFALKILVKREEKENTASLAALELREHFEEILIDEYQDSNLVQETILKSVSKEEIGCPNRFMVGDIKQSIYKFRLAMPELFMEKYNTYSTEDVFADGSENLTQRIDLDKNFRSRKVVLDSINGIFYQIMKACVGGIDYDEAASLKPGANYPEPILEEGQSLKYSKDVEILLIGDDVEAMKEKTCLTEEEEHFAEQEAKSASQERTREDNASEEKEAIDEELEELKERELEARAVCKKIKELTSKDTGLYVFDDSLEVPSYRLCRYSDIVILLRSVTGWADTFVNTLMADGIPAYADTSVGYFQTIEVRTIINLLRVIDNPRQDIPLASVAYSPIGGFTSEELALLRTEYRTSSLYLAMVRSKADYEVLKEKQSLTEEAMVQDTMHQNAMSDETGSNIEQNRQTQMYQKISKLFRLFDTYRELLTYESISEVILRLMKESGYYYYVAAMPGGERRRANLDLLVSYAMKFEKGSYKGLFHFVRYLEKLHTYQVDFGEAQTASTQDDNSIRIMSIHKSKGLEFPVCFVSGLAKKFNMQDFRDKLILHSEFGVGPEYIDINERVKAPTLIKKVIQKQVLIENIGEELRVLYVALTRAKEKLIMTGMYKDKIADRRDFSYFDIMNKQSYLEYVLPASLNYIGEQLAAGVTPDIRILYQDTMDLLRSEAMSQSFDESDKQAILSISDKQVYDENVREALQNLQNYSYPYAEEASLKFKVSVSELKHQSQVEMEKMLLEDSGISEEYSKSEMLYDRNKRDESNVDKEKKVLLPNFLMEEETITGAALGTVYHKILELLPLAKISRKEDLQQVLNSFLQQGKLTAEELNAVHIDYVNDFLQSSLGLRMRNAAKENKLYREKQFVIGVPATDMFPEKKTQELILIQGIIDAFFLEEGQVVLVDYKSDYIPPNAMDDFLISRYQTQLDYYEKALEKIMGCTVKEKLIYSIQLKKTIAVPSYHK